jgi:catechol 2,3-dioxygenase-like lactoylglutathione lyase family enzyme
MSFLNRLRYPSPDDGSDPQGAQGAGTAGTSRDDPPWAAYESAAPGPTSASDVEVLFAAVSVADFDGAVDWYTRLFGRPPDIDVHDTEVMWRILDGAWLYVVLDRDRAGKSVVTLSVGDLDTTAARIAARGVRTASFEQVGDAGRKATFRDPDGNVISFAEVYQGKR